MLGSLLLIEAILLACVLAGWAVGRLVSRRISLGGDGESSDGELTDALAFVGAAFGIILGLLLVFAVQHYNDASTATREEAIHAVAVFNAAHPYPAAERDQLRRDLICSMRSVAADDFPAAGALDLDGSATTSAWLQRVQSDIDGLSQDKASEASTHQIITGEALELLKSRSLMLVGSQPEIPLVIWLVIFASTFAFVVLLVMHLSTHRRLAVVSVVAVCVVLLVVVGVLTDLDYPFSGDGGSVTPSAMNAALSSLQRSYPDLDWSACPALPPSA